MKTNRRPSLKALLVGAAYAAVALTSFAKPIVQEDRLGEALYSYRPRYNVRHAEWDLERGVSEELLYLGHGTAPSNVQRFDDLFFMHHASVDRFWFEWQQR